MSKQDPNNRFTQFNQHNQSIQHNQYSHSSNYRPHTRNHNFPHYRHNIRPYQPHKQSQHKQRRGRGRGSRVHWNRRTHQQSHSLPPQSPHTLSNQRHFNHNNQNQDVLMQHQPTNPSDTVTTSIANSASQESVQPSSNNHSGLLSPKSSQQPPVIVPTPPKSRNKQGCDKFPRPIKSSLPRASTKESKPRQYDPRLELT